jgi:hypothetical protein
MQSQPLLAPLQSHLTAKLATPIAEDQSLESIRQVTEIKRGVLAANFFRKEVPCFLFYVR